MRRAQDLATAILADDQALLGHSQTAAEQAARACARLGCRDTDVVVAATWLHDIGYAHTLRSTGFHPMDGALALMKDDWPDRVISLVAHHSQATMEAPYYSVAHHLRLIDSVSGLPADIVTFADVTSSRSGGIVTPAARIEQLRQDDIDSGSPVPVDVRESRYASLISTTRFIADQVDR